MNSYDRRSNLVELDRAIDTGREVFYCLKRAEEKLNKASGWGAIDLVWANFITSSLKHRRIAEANREIEQARVYLEALNHQLGKTVLPDNLNVHVNEISRIADVWFASRVMDVYFQDKINDALDGIEKAKSQVKQVVKEMKKVRELEANVVSEA